MSVRTSSGSFTDFRPGKLTIRSKPLRLRGLPGLTTHNWELSCGDCHARGRRYLGYAPHFSEPTNLSIIEIAVRHARIIHGVSL